MAKPFFWILAGPNGSGKSTLANKLFKQEQILNPDNIAQRLSPGAPEKVSIQAGRETIKEFSRRLAKGETFTMETTLSGNLHHKLVKRAKAAGWRIGLLYVCLENKTDNLKRVAERKLKGGHTVPAEHVLRRYDRSLDNLPKILQQADLVAVYDNSTKMRRIIEGRRGRVTWANRDLPDWAKKALQKELKRYRDQERNRSR